MAEETVMLKYGPSQSNERPFTLDQAERIFKAQGKGLPDDQKYHLPNTHELKDGKIVRTNNGASGEQPAKRSGRASKKATQET